MRLDRYDAGATFATAVAAALYAGHVNDVAPLSGPRVAGGLILFAGLAACATDGSRGNALTQGWYSVVASTFGLAAMVAGLGALTLGSEGAVQVLIGIVAAMWVVTTTVHLLRREPTPAPVRTAEHHRPMAGVR